MPSVVAKLQHFERKNGWYYVAIPHKSVDPYRGTQDRGLIPIIATISGLSWQTSLLPMGDGSHFIPIPKKLRNTHSMQVGDKVSLSFLPRK